MIEKDVSNLRREMAKILVDELVKMVSTFIAVCVIGNREEHFCESINLSC